MIKISRASAAQGGSATSALVGSRFVSRVPVMDASDYVEREAPAGELGAILHYDPRTACFSVVFWPSGIENYWTLDEIRRQGRPAQAGDVPAPAHERAVRAFDLLLAWPRVDEEEGVVRIPEDRAAEIRTLAQSAASDPTVSQEAAAALLDLAHALPPPGDVCLSFDDVNKLNAALGIRERLVREAAPPALPAATMGM